MSDYVLVLVSVALVNHLALQPGLASRARVHVLGLCSALLILLTLVAARWVPQQLQDLQLLLFLPLQATLAWALPSVLQRLRPAWPVAGLGPALAGNAAVLGLLMQLRSDTHSIGQVLLWGLTAALGFWLALELFADLRERSQHSDIPKALRGLPIELIGAGVMTLAFSGLNGLFTS